MPFIDLHTHTVASDGTFTPEQLVAKAAEVGLRAVAVTDHDTVEGVAIAQSAGIEKGVEVVSGIEFSVDFDGGSMHLLGYGFDPTYPPLLEVTHTVNNARNIRNAQMVVKLQKLSYHIELEDVSKFSREGTMGRAHIARALIEKGYFKIIEEAFADLLNKDGAAYVDRYRLHIKEACDLLHRAGGIAVWAHPGVHGTAIRSLIEDSLPGWVKDGLDGLESDYSQHKRGFANKLRKTARDNGLIYTGGSDFHGDIKPNIQLGIGCGNKQIDDHILEMVYERIQHYR